jgi:uncharacterized phosphosugar-binding protein
MNNRESNTSAPDQVPPLSFQNYFTHLIAILNRVVDEQGAAIQQAAKLVTECLNQGGIVHTFGTGHAHLIAAEPFYRAGGLVPVNAILDDRITFSRGALESTDAERTPRLAAIILESIPIEHKDVAIVISNSGRNAVPVEMALAFKDRDVRVIAITSLAQSQASSPRNLAGLRLFEVADVVIDNCVPVGDGVLSIPGVRFPVGPTSTVAGAAIINAIFVQSAIILAKNGKPVPVLPSGNLENVSAEDVRETLRPYRGRITYLGFDDDVQQASGSRLK